MLALHYGCLIVANLGLAWSSSIPARNENNRAAYFLDNDPVGNYIIALKISSEDGTLSSPVRTATGGTGLAGLLAPSQDSVVVSEDGYLFTINTQSNTVSMFKIDNEDPWHPKLVGSPAATLGDTPITVAYSTSLKTACVANAGLVAGVTCYAVDGKKGLTIIGSLRSIPQPTDPGVRPPVPLIIAQDIVFNPSSTGLFVSVSSNGDAPGYILAYPVKNGQVSTEGVKSPTPDITLPFSLNFLGSDSVLLTTNPVPHTAGAAVLDVGPSLSITAQKPIVIPGQLAACWVAYSPHAYSAYIIDAATTNITVIDTPTGNTRGTINFSAVPMTGGLDAAIDRGRLYLLTDAPSPKIEVFKLHEHENDDLADLIQSYDVFSNVGVLPFWMGMSIYPA